jgi:phenylacetate-CoA ligase
VSENLLGLVLDVRRAKREGEAGIARRQRERLGAMVAFARVNSPFYQKLYDGLPADAPLEQLPVTSKKALMGAFDDWLTDRSVRFAEARVFANDPGTVGEPFRGYTLATTSGTSGTKGIFLFDRKAMAVTQAIAFRMLTSWLGFGDFLRIIAGRGRMAMVMAKGGHFASAVAAAGLQRRRRKGSMLVLSVHDPVPELVNRLNEFEPALMAPYASIAALLATEQEQGRLHINPVLLALSAEGLAVEEYSRIAKAFNAKVGNSYASTEVPFLSFSCDHGWLHVNTDWVTCEAVDADYKPVAKGEVSHTVLVSNLANRLQPVLRYDLGDSIIERPDRCPCGSPFPAIRVQGRASDLVHFEAPGGNVTMPPMAFYMLLDPIPGIDLYQVVQTGPAALRVRLRISADAAHVWQQVESGMKELLERHGLGHVRIEQGREPPEQTAGGKFRNVIPLKSEGPKP